MPIIGTLPNNIQNGQAVDAAPVMADFNFIANQVNANANPIGVLTAPSGTRVIFNQSTAPLGWVLDNTVTDHTVQLGIGGVNVVTTGNPYSSLFFAPWTSDGHALSVAELAAHNHSDSGHTHAVTDPQHNHGPAGGGAFYTTQASGTNYGGGATSFTPVASTANASTGVSINAGNANIQNTGSGNAHSHTKTFNVNYCQCIVAQKS